MQMSWMTSYSYKSSFDADLFVASNNCLASSNDMASRHPTIHHLVALLARGMDRHFSTSAVAILVRLTAPTELEEILHEAKVAFTDAAVTKAVVYQMKYLIEQDSPLTLEQCDSINNCLLLLTNILHVPEVKSDTANPHSSLQNRIIWNLFTQSIDKIIIYLVSCPQRIYWSVTLVQLISLMYKDQHVGTLQKLLNLWLEASFSESSEDNESNTSPPDQGSGESSPVITSDPTSDSSDTGGSVRNNKVSTTQSTSDRKQGASSEGIRAASRSKTLSNLKRNKSTETESSGVSSMGQSQESSENDRQADVASSSVSSSSCEKQGSALQSITPTNSSHENTETQKRDCSSTQSEISDCGYVTQVENQESISTSSNDDDQPRPVHQKPQSQKTRYNLGKMNKKELRRKRLVKRSKINFIKTKGLSHHLPTDDDVAALLKEFTVDFLLKGYASLVRDLHAHLIANIHLQIDTSHFFWLVTYFIQFSAQLELDMEHVSPVLSYDILAYLVFQGIWLSEELELSCRVTDVDLKPCLRRLHLVVTAIREFLQGVETYQRMIHLSDEDRNYLQNLQRKICETEELKLIFVRLLRQYNPVVQSKQYLQDLILTNHNFLLFLDNTSTTEKEHFEMVDHLKQFATVEIMKQYGILLENFKENGEYVNNCIFTMMHHIAGDLKNVPTLFQPTILKTFSQIFETDYEICDDWSDLIEYVIHKFINTPRSTSSPGSTTPVPEDFTEIASEKNETQPMKSEYNSPAETLVLFRWTKEEKDNLLGYYYQSQNSLDLIANITQKYHENGMCSKSQLSIIRELLEQNIISENQYVDFMKTKTSMESGLDETNNVEIFDYALNTNEKDLMADGDVKVLKEYLYRENKGKSIRWLQSVLLETCYAKLVLGKPEEFQNVQTVMEPTIYYYVLLNLSVPIVAWTTEQTEALKHQPLVLLLHKLGFHLPADTGKIFIRIPNFWHAEYIFLIAQQLGPVDAAKLKFDIDKVGAKNSEAPFVRPHAVGVARHNDYEKFATVHSREAPSVVRYTPLPNSTEWFQIVSHPVAMMDVEVYSGGSSLSTRPFTTPMDCSPHDHVDRVSTCDTASVTSGLTRMCVSDEDDKPMDESEKKSSKNYVGKGHLSIDEN